MDQPHHVTEIASITRTLIMGHMLLTLANHPTTTISIGPSRTIFQAGVRLFRHLHIIATILGRIQADHVVYRTTQTVAPLVVIRI